NAMVTLADGAHSMREALHLRSEDTLRFIGEQFGTQNFGPLFGQTFGWIVGIVFFFLLVSAANTAIVAMIGLLYMMARDHEMPPVVTTFNGPAVPRLPILIAYGLPVLDISA